MARPIKTGLDYFPFDVTFFSNDKIQLTESEFGILGSNVAIRLISKIYTEGYYYKFGEDELKLFVRNIGLKEVTLEVTKNIIHYLIEREFFNKDIFQKYSILTSKGIQERFLEATQRRKKVEMIEEICLADDVSVNPNIIIKSLNGDYGNAELMLTLSTQRKGKEKERKEEEIKALGVSTFTLKEELEKMFLTFNPRQLQVLESPEILLENWNIFNENLKKYSTLGKAIEPFNIYQFIELKLKYFNNLHSRIDPYLQQMHSYYLKPGNVLGSAYCTLLDWIRKDDNGK